MSLRFLDRPRDRIEIFQEFRSEFRIYRLEVGDHPLDTIPVRWPWPLGFASVEDGSQFLLLIFRQVWLDIDNMLGNDLGLPIGGKACLVRVRFKPRLFYYSFDRGF